MRRFLGIFLAGLGISLVAIFWHVQAVPGKASAPPGAAPAAGRPATGAPPAGAREKEHDAAPKIAVSRIAHVTIYPDSALITREVDVPAGAGLMELVVNPLPLATVSTSLYTESVDGVRVLTTRFRTRPVLEDTREEVRKIEEEIKKFQQQQRKLQADIRLVEENRTQLGNLEKFTLASTTHATEKGKLDSEATIALSKYLMEGRTAKSKELMDLTEQSLTLAEQMEFAQRKLRNLTAGTSKTERDAVLVVDKANPGPGKVMLNYLVNTAAWRPQYKFRAGKTAKDPVVVEYLAGIVQQTGEDWERVGITLSTAQPMLNAAPPELQALAVAVVPRGTQLPGMSVSGLQQNLGQLGGQLGGFGMNNDVNRPAMPPGGGGAGMGPMGGPGSGGMPGGMMGQAATPQQKMDVNNRGNARLALSNPEGTSVDELNKAVQDLRRRAQDTFNRERNQKDASELANYASVLEQARDLVLLPGKKALSKPGPKSSNEGPTVTYHLAAKLSIPSRNDDQVIEVAKIDLEPDYFYKAIPVLTPHVYRQANLVNNSKMVLLPGEATMYHGNDFVGRMELPLVAIGELFTVGFGAEPQLQVQRQMLDRTRSMQAGNQVLKYEYRILINSYKSEKVKMQIWDRLPHAEKEAMGVTLIKTTPELCKDPVYVREDRSNNLLRWDVDIEPNMKGENAHKIQYDFQLELDRQATLGSFQTK